MVEQTNDGRWKPGQSGNPSGRPQGARAKALIAFDQLGEDSTKEIVEQVIAKAKGGDVMAIRTVLERTWPVRKGRKLTFELPEVKTAAELPGAIAAISRQVAEGELTPDEGAMIVGLLESQRRAIETSELAARVAALEERLGSK